MEGSLTIETGAVLAVAGDATATRTVYVSVVALVLIGLVLLFLAIWLYRQTRPDPPLLAPLERMDDRSWRKQDPAEAQRELDRLRPDGARPVAKAKHVPSVDSQFAASSPALNNFDDLASDFAADGSGELLSEEHRPVARPVAPRAAAMDPLMRFDADQDESSDIDRDGISDRLPS